MSTLLNVLHVLSAVLLIGPLIVAPFVGRRAIARRSADLARAAANQMAFFGAGSILVAVLGAFAVFGSDRYRFSTPWVIISATLYVIAFLLVFVYAVPALRKAARIIEDGVLEAPLPEADTDEGQALTTTATDLLTKERLDAIAGRVAGASLLVLLVFAAITVLMTARPFGS